jgi:hypothetical protein
MRTLVMSLALMGLLTLTAGMAAAADLKVIQTAKSGDVVVTLLSETGQWKQGSNAFVLELTSAVKQPLDGGKVALNTAMPMPGMAPMVAGAKLMPDKSPGRWLGTISFPDSGARQVTVTWDGPAGRGSAKFTVPVR